MGAEGWSCRQTLGAAESVLVMGGRPGFQASTAPAGPCGLRPDSSLSLFSGLSFPEDEGRSSSQPLCFFLSFFFLSLAMPVA